MRLLPVLPLALLVACQEYSVNEGKDVLQGDDLSGEPDIEVAPPEVAFGQVSVGDTVAHVQTVTVSNIGDAALEINSLALEDTNAPFQISAIGSVLIPPGQSTTFTVTYTPLTAEASETNVLVQSNDPDEEYTLVHLLGQGVAPVIQLDPETFDFGTNYIGCDTDVPIKIKNVGNADLHISSLNYITASTDLTVNTNEAVNGPLPWTIAPQAEVEVAVTYSPLDDYTDEGYLAVESDDPLRSQVQAYQTGVGAVYGTNLDSFTQPLKGLSDIVFTLDWSCSMYDDIALVQSNFTVFINTLAGMDADYHVAVVTDDDGCVNGYQPYIDNTMDPSDQVSLFDTMVNNYAYGSNTERGFTLLEAATTSSNMGGGGCNEDMIREDAKLSLVGVTDEVEQSANPWTYYVSYFQGLKRNPDDVVINAIAGDYPNGCNGNQPGTGWYEATVATGGLFLSICATDWASHLQALAEGAAADLSSFELTQWAVPETIVVRIDGVTTTTGWTYVEPDNSVKFEEQYIPEGGATIDIEYNVAGGCGD